MMAGLPEKSFIERWVTPTAIISLATAIIGQLLFTVWWARGESSRITAVEVMATGLRQDIFTFNTPLSARVLKIESRLEDMQRQQTDFHARIDSIDFQGTRALAVINSNQQRGMNQADRLAERIIMLDKRVNDADARSAQTAVLATEKMTALDKRLDNIERRLTEFLAVVSHGPKLQGDSRSAD